MLTTQFFCCLYQGSLHSHCFLIFNHAPFVGISPDFAASYFKVLFFHYIKNGEIKNKCALRKHGFVAGWVILYFFYVAFSKSLKHKRRYLKLQNKRMFL